MRDYKAETWYKLAKTNVARVIRSMRIVENLTQVELASALRNTQSGISDMEKGTTSPELATIFRYAEACGFDVEITFKRKPGLPLDAHFTLNSKFSEE